MNNDVILIVDGLNLFFRNFSQNPSTDINGKSIGGVLGSIKSIGHASAKFRASKVFVIFDGKDAFLKRRNIYPNYKLGWNFTKRINRQFDYESDSERNEDMFRQILMLSSYLQYLPVKIISIDNLESCDIISHICKNYFKDSIKIIMSTSKKFTQLVDMSTRLWYPTQDILYNENNVCQQFGVYPVNFIFTQIFEGDAKSNIQGISGIGNKRLLKMFPFLKDNQPSNLDYIKQYSIDNLNILASYQKVLDNYNTLLMNKQVMDLSNVQLNASSQILLSHHVESDSYKLDIQNLFLKFKEDQSIQTTDEFKNWIHTSFKHLNQTIDDGLY